MRYRLGQHLVICIDQAECKTGTSMYTSSRHSACVAHHSAQVIVTLLQALRPLLERIQVDLSAGRRSATELSPVVRRVYTVLEDCRAVVNEWCEGGAGAGAVS